MKKYFCLLIILLVSSLNFNLILKPLKLVTGGTQGLALVINNITGLSPSLVILLINVVMLVLSYIFLSKETTCGTIVSTFIYPLFIRLTGNMAVIGNSKNILVFVIISGIVCGITCGYIYKLGFSSGGVSILPILLNKYFKFKVSFFNFFINALIIVLSYVQFGVVKCIYSLLVIIINSYIINKILMSDNTIV